MKIKRLIIPGSFVEAYVYFDFLWLVSKDRVIRAFDLETYCHHKLNEDADAASRVFADNQRLSSNEAETDRFLKEESSVEVALSDVDKFSYIFETDIEFQSVLSMRFYYSRGFMGTEESIIQFNVRGRSDMDQNLIGRTASQGLSEQQVSDRPARQLQARYGAIGAVCGRAGGLVGLGAISGDSRWRINFKQFTKESFGMEFNGNAISSLDKVNVIELYSARTRLSNMNSTEVTATGDKRERLEVVNVSDRVLDDRATRLNDLIEGDGGASRVFLFKATVWVISKSGQLRQLKMADRDRILENPSESRVFVKPPKRVLSTSSTAAGILVEADDDVYILNRGQWVRVLDEPVFSVRGYPQSRRYQKLATAVTQDRVELMAII